MRPWLAVAVWLASTWLGLAALPARAQTDEATLVSVTLADTSPSETHLVLTFSGSPPALSISGNDSARPAISLARTSRAPGANSPTFVRGYVRDVAFDQRGSDLVLIPVGPGAIHVEAAPVGGQTVFITVRAAGAELVMLHYADVSEIVGLLSAGPAQKPNDTFIPQEPAFGSSGITGQGNNTYQQNASLLNQEALPIGTQVDDTIGIDRRLNAVILRGPPERIRRLRDRIAQLDVPVNSVLLETVFV